MKRAPLATLISMVVMLLLVVAMDRLGPTVAPDGMPTFLRMLQQPRALQGEPPQPFTPRVEVVATGLEAPWALAFAPDGRLFFTERPGRLRVIVDGRLQSDPVATLRVAVIPQAETGLMGLALDPGFENNGFAYVMYGVRDPVGRLRSRISRLTVKGNRAADERVLLDGIPGGTIHDGGRLRFGPGGRLFATTGDTNDQSLPRDLKSLAGKILRLKPDGSIPGDNPFPGSPVFSLGHRNPQGLAFQPETGDLFSTEHGPVGNDEVNVVEAGEDYGWPAVQGMAGDERFVDPILTYSPSIAPSGADFYDGRKLPGWTGSLFFATLRGMHLHRVELGGSGSRRVVAQERLFEGSFGRLRDVVQGPDGYLYFATNNRDGRGNPGPDDDRILRVVP